MSDDLTGYPGVEPAADLAAAAVLLDIAERLGVSHFFDGTVTFNSADVAAAARVPEAAAESYLEALDAAALVTSNGDGRVRAADDLRDRRHASGYLLWALDANRPFLENVADYLRDPAGARERYQRDGRRVAVTSRWIGEEAFYPTILSTIIDCEPNRMVDLGAGAAGLLVQVLQELPECTGVALDISPGACEEATAAAERHGVAERLAVVERSIQSLVDDPSPLNGADLITAGFVFHDLLPEEEEVCDAVLRTCHEALPPGGSVAISEAVPYETAERERRFSSLFTYTHMLMGRQLLNEKQWLAKLAAAGFSAAKCVPHRFPGGRLFLASR